MPLGVSIGAFCESLAVVENSSFYAPIREIAFSETVSSALEAILERPTVWPAEETTNVA